MTLGNLDLLLCFSLRCISALEALKLESKDEQLGVDIVMRALRTPCGTIAKNAGVDPSVVVQRVMTGDSPSMGYDALHDRYVDMILEGECTVLLRELGIIF